MFKDYMQARKAKGYKSVNEASPDSVREDGSNQRKYRAAEGVPAATHPAVAALAEAALALLEAGAEGRNSWQRTLQSPGNVTFQLRLTGPDLPASVPPETVHPTDVPKDRAWTGSHRLTVAAPLLAFDIYWTPGAPLRIMTYNRGTWEDALLALT